MQRRMEMGSSNHAAELVLNPQFSIISNTSITSPSIPECALKQKYVENSLSMREIAREFSCSKTYIRSMFLRYKIHLRKTSDYRGSKRFAYGKRQVSGKTVDHKGEQRTIATIKQMYSEGVSTVAIARFLNTMKIPTKQQGKGWHRGMVAKILAREGLHKPRKAQQTELSA